MRAMLLSAALCAAAAVSVFAQDAFAQDKATIERLNDKFAQAFNKGDAAAVASMYTQDAVVLPPGAEMAKGRSAIQAFWKKSAEQIGDLKLTALEVKPLGKDAAREIGTFTLKTKAQPPQEVAGKYVVVWHKVGRGWKLGTDIWNANE
jgi:uncharacterized protein (TIGR02246 family)